MAYIYDIADTWNASGTTFTAIKMNVTDTSSAAGSLLMDLQVGGSSRFKVTKDGEVNLGSSDNYAKIDGVSSGVGRELLLGNAIVRAVGIRGNLFVTSSYIAMFNSSTFSWGNDPRLSVGDLVLARDAANTLAQRNGVNAQAFNLYNTYTDASNYERGFMRFVSNVLEIGTQAAGTGANRGVTIKAGTQSWVLDAAVGTTIFPNSIALGASANISLQGASSVSFSTRGLVDFPADGVARFFRSFGAGFERIVFQDSTSAGASLKRSATSLQARLGDDSAFTNIQGKLTTDTAYTAGAPTATGYITLYDSTGTAYRVPCVV